MFEVEVNNFDFEPIYSAQFENYTDAVKDFSNIVLSLTSSRAYTRNGEQLNVSLYDRTAYAYKICATCEIIP